MGKMHSSYCVYAVIALPILVAVVLLFLKIRKHCCPSNKQLLRINITNASNPIASNTVLYRPGQPMQLQITNPPSTAIAVPEPQYMTQPCGSSCNSLYGRVPEERRHSGCAPAEPCPSVECLGRAHQHPLFYQPQRRADFMTTSGTEGNSWKSSGQRSLDDHVYEEIEFKTNIRQ